MATLNPTYSPHAAVPADAAAKGEDKRPGGDDQNVNRILFVRVQHAPGMVLPDHLYSVFSKFGTVEKIVLMPKGTSPQLLVQFADVVAAQTAFETTHNTEISGPGSGTLRVGYSNLEEVKMVRFPALARRPPLWNRAANPAAPAAVPLRAQPNRPTHRARDYTTGEPPVPPPADLGAGYPPAGYPPAPGAKRRRVDGEPPAAPYAAAPMYAAQPPYSPYGAPPAGAYPPAAYPAPAPYGAVPGAQPPYAAHPHAAVGGVGVGGAAPYGYGAPALGAHAPLAQAYAPRAPRAPRGPGVPGESAVVMVSGINSELVMPETLAALFGVYGNVVKVKMLPKRQAGPGSALVEFSEREMAAQAVANMSNAPLAGELLTVKPSSADTIKDAKARDFRAMPQRYGPGWSKDDVLYQQSCVPPSPELRVWGFPPEVTDEEVRAHVARAGGSVLSVSREPKVHQEGVDMASVPTVFVVRLGTTEEAVHALILTHNSTFAAPSGQGFQLSVLYRNMNLDAFS